MFYFCFSFETNVLQCVGNALHVVTPCANDQLTVYVALFRAESIWYKSCVRNSARTKSFREKYPCSLPKCLCLRNYGFRANEENTQEGFSFNKETETKDQRWQ